MVTNCAVILLVNLSVICVYAIRVPTDWNGDSDVSENLNQASTANQAPVSIPVEYFQYPDKKPQFAVEIATFHGVKHPENHYTSYPIRPYTGRQKPELGKHKILQDANPVFQQFQQFAQINEGDKVAIPVSSNYEVFHPYEAEKPALQEIYKDPVLDKIRNDIYNSQNRLQKHEKEAGKPDIQNGEYLERPEQTDRRKIPHRNIPVSYERHRPQRRPIYYRPGPNFSREQALNQKFRHPWNQHDAKIRPLHYQPLKNHIHRLRQQHAVKFDDERNEYPQIPALEQYAEVPDGYDIYKRGKEKYVALRNNVDESINNAVKKNHPVVHQKLELQNNGHRTAAEIHDVPDDEEPEFVPIKNYAQVRKTETQKHLPREAAFADAVSFDEIRNAPRLREAVKSTKAQTVYTEEGYEDAAYDHAGEEKHAAENEGHGGYLKEKEISGGKYKTPELSGNYEDSGGNEYRDQTLHGEKWKNDDKDKEEETDEEDYSEDDIAQSVEAEVYDEVTGERNKRQNDSGEKVDENIEKEETNDNESSEKEIAAVERRKRENKFENSSSDTQDSNNINVEHELEKRETRNEGNRIKIPVLDLNSTFLTEEELFNMAKLKVESKPKQDDIKEKYPYYFENLKNLHEHSPLRYAENLKLIPKKSKGGTEFYDSRSIWECPEVEDDVDPIPEKIKKGKPKSDESAESGESDSQKMKGKADFEQIKKKRRLRGLGDKIDCFKAKYFGENPLDSPFFKEEIISNPEPITAPSLPTYKFNLKEPILQASNLNNVFNEFEKLKENTKSGVLNLFDKLKGEQENLQDSLVKTNNNLIAPLAIPQNFTILSNTQLSQQANVYTDILENIKNNRPIEYLSGRIKVPNNSVQTSDNKSIDSDTTYTAYQNKKGITQLPPSRKKRGAPFKYEPYKIIRDFQAQESRKTATITNVSPLIKKLQSSKLVDGVAKPTTHTEDSTDKLIGATRNYKDIGRKEREKNSQPILHTSEVKFIDVNVDQRRGEPRYEIRLPNHKEKYTPVENKKAMTVEDYQAQTNKTVRKPELRLVAQIKETTTAKLPSQDRKISRAIGPSTTARPFFDVSEFIPKAEEIQKTAASNTVKKVVQSPESNKKVQDTKSSDEDDEDEEYEEYDDEEATTTTTTTTTQKPSFRRRRIKPTTTTTTSTQKPEEELEYPKLRLITKFRSTVAPITTEKAVPATEKPMVAKQNDEESSPKYREKKKKSSKSTLVTDTKTYGDDNDTDMMKDEVDAMIGVQQDMDEYKPKYEKEVKKSHGKIPISSGSDEDESDSAEEEDEEFEDDDEDENEEEESSEFEAEEELPVTTPEPTKRTLLRTTEAPISTTETRNAKLELKPVVHKKKIEIHKEIPMDKSSPHITQFKQDFKEVEIIKEMPPKAKPQKTIQRKPQKNLEALDLYKDENLAKEVNKLGAVEVFKEDLDLEKGPRHGGNYRSAQLVDLNTQVVTTTSQPSRSRKVKPAKDPDTSQTKNAKLVEFTEVLPARRLHSQIRNKDRSARLELDDEVEVPKKLHGGNLKSVQDTNRRRNNNKNAKFIELDDEHDTSDEDSRGMHGGNFKSHDSSRSSGRPLHGGNYRSAKLTQKVESETTTEKVKSETANYRGNSAILLNNFAQAVPILTSTPAYILDPSKRMYYYVDDK